MRKMILMSLFFATSCGTKEADTDTGGGSSSTDADADGGGEGGGLFEDFINVTDAPIGDLSCLTGTLGTETAAAGCVAQRSMSGTVLDFQDDYPVDEAQVELFFEDGIFGAADDTVTSDPNGVFNVEVNTCAPFTYRVSTDPVLDATKVTIESHDVLPHKGAINPVSHELNSVSSTTYALIPTLLGVSPDVEKGVVAGVAYDCAGGKIEGVQVMIEGASGNIPESVVAKYFRDDFPNRNQPYTSDDGLWILMDVPTGDWIVKGYVADGLGGHTLVAQTELKVLADSINISSIHAGISDGVKMPPDCLTACN
jgi:hypothetical protein